MGDAARLRQVLLNLAGNAIKFTEQGGVAVIVEPGDARERNSFPGARHRHRPRAEDQARIFLDFEQADGSSTRKFGGTGLGLAISKRIVERMDGRIAVESEAGARRDLQLHACRCSRRLTTPAPDFVAPDLAGKTAVMIVAAAEIEASLLARRLGRWGAKTCAVVDEKIASALLPERHWDALLVDYPLARP